ncbi:hypothetical protein ACFFUB_01835 [Algimonas porphyrae]|uniref:Uncharacterized protein n=1 Tax=Algimonas porphyrae TaxID=1128113 RepID=A0ABQ5V290_9PROT|nr:hypothetical protein [Algimonas porphyrae]GLQ20780.1 hypothetical protein GCM10007854_17350 [Algimonas porphyrae]
MSDLQSLWQSSAPPLDADKLIARLQKQNRALRRVNRISFAVSLISLIVILALEFLGRIPTKGLLSLLGAGGLIWSVWKYRRDKARLIAAYSEEPGKLLPFLIKRTRAARNLGLYFLLTPLPSIGLGYGVGYLFDRAGHEDAANPDILLAIIVPALLLVAALMIYGYRLARRKSTELEELLALQAERHA